VPITFDQPTWQDPAMWTPSGTLSNQPNGASVLLQWALLKPSGVQTNGQLATACTITGTTWHYPPPWQTALNQINYVFGDQITLTARMFDSSFTLVATSNSITGGLLPPPTYPPANMMVPDVAAAVVIRLKRAPQIQALCGDRVSIILKSSWNMPQYAIIVTGVSGSSPDQELDRMFQRLDIRFFGPGTDYNVRQRNAIYLWRTAHFVLQPPVQLRIPAAFHAAHCIVQNVRQDVPPMRLVEPGTDWPVVLVPYIASYMATAI
jgi:hypothetical protein